MVIIENGVGTWVHADLAEIFAQWISVEYRFAVVHLIRDAKQNKINQEFPNQITGVVPTNPATDFAKTLRGVVDAVFPHLEQEFRDGVVIEGLVKKHPELGDALRQYKPKLLIDAPLLSPTEIALKLEAKDGIKRSGIAINKMLKEQGFQVKTGDKKLAYRAIGQGIEFSKVIADTAVGHGKTVTALRWYESIVDLLTV